MRVIGERALIPYHGIQLQTKSSQYSQLNRILYNSVLEEFLQGMFVSVLSKQIYVQIYIVKTKAVVRERSQLESDERFI